ncbi:MAG: hypothetical protein NVS4B6_18930 [Mycobacterium sp.]
MTRVSVVAPARFYGFPGARWCRVVRPDTIDLVKPRWNLLGKYMLAAATVAGVPAVVWVVINHHGRLWMFGLVGVLALTVGMYIGLQQPLWLYWGLAAVMGALPFAYVPGVHLPMYLLFTVGVLLAALIHTTEQSTLRRLEAAVFLLVLAAGVSVIATGITGFALLSFARWALASLTVIALLRLSRENLEKFGRIFVYGATVNAIAGIAMVTVDKEQRLLKPLKIFGYGVGAGLRENTQLYVYSDQGQGVVGKTIRLGGTWVLPNSAGFCLTIALIMSLVLFRGWWRGCFALILFAAMVLTLSRATLFGVAAGLVLVFIFHTMRARDRWIGLGTVAVGAALVFLVPFVRKRVLNSFASEDKGRSDRVAALENFPHQMSGHWAFGVGWDRPEFRTGQAAQTFNYVSNAPLLTVYRAGIFTGLIFTAILLMACGLGYIAIRSRWLPNALFGGVFVGLALVYMNLAQSVVDMPVMTLQFAIALAFVVYVGQNARDESQTRQLASEQELVPPKQPVPA